MKLATYMLEEREDKSLAMEDLLQMTKFVSKNNHFDLNSRVKKHISGTAIGITFGHRFGDN